MFENTNQNCYLHRISYENSISYPLLDKHGHIAIGWQCLLDDNEFMENFKSDKNKAIDSVAQTLGRRKEPFRRFCSFIKGDIVLVPKYNGIFSLYEVIESVIPITEMKIDELKNWHNQAVKLDVNVLTVNENQYKYDIGFVVKVKPIKENIPRNFAEASLVSRMKVRQSTVNINDLKDEVKKASEATSTPSLYEKIIEATGTHVLESIQNITPDNFERLIKWYMDRTGASLTYIPAKNESGKENGADADIVAEFDDLGIIFYIQGKCHKGTTGDWAVNQIKEYKEQKQDTDNDYTYVSWVISTAGFDEKVQNTAKEVNVRLIDGKEFAKMLLHVGFKSIDDCIK